MNILVDIVILVVLRRFNWRSGETVDSERSECGRSRCGRVGRLSMRVASCACVRGRAGTGSGRTAARGRDVQRESVLSFYFTNNNPEETRYK